MAKARMEQSKIIGLRSGRFACLCCIQNTIICTSSVPCLCQLLKVGLRGVKMRRLNPSRLLNVTSNAVFLYGRKQGVGVGERSLNPDLNSKQYAWLYSIKNATAFSYKPTAVDLYRGYAILTIGFDDGIYV